MRFNYISIPISLIRIAGSQGRWNDLKYFLELKLQYGGILRKGAFPRRKMRRLVELGFVGENKHLYFLRSWDDLEEIHGRSGRVRFYEEYFEKDFETILFWMAICYLLRIHSGSHKNAQRRKRRGKRQLRPDMNNGGISNSLASAFFGKCKTWSSKMRRKCEQEGLLAFHRRSVVATLHDKMESRYLGKDFLHHVAGEGKKVFREITSLCVILELPEFFW